MEALVDIINQLQDVFAASDCSGIDLPQIVVVGSQSAGKSSVLEHIVGKSFLPRGSGIVTRCPLILQLVHAPEKKEECAFFQHTKDKMFTDYNEIREEIENYTLRIAGTNKGIVHTPINLKIYSPSVLNLTLVDLPGITKVPVGDQPLDIEQQIKTLIYTYIENPNSIILAVTPANVDMANSESLKIATEVDPEGERTLAVLTKLDLMDEGTDAWDMLNGDVIPVKLGIIGVVNRSQKDIQEEKSIEDSIRDEEIYFAKHYKSICSEHGSNYLTSRVQEILVSHIRKCMPALKERINQKLQTKLAELSNYAVTNMDSNTVLLDLISKFSQSFVSSIKGDVPNIETKELQGGARINFVFQSKFSTDLKTINPLDNLKENDVKIAMDNASGIYPAIFVPEVAFVVLVKKQLESFLTPSLTCVNLVYDELNNIARSCFEQSTLGLQRYPKLIPALSVAMDDILKGQLPETKKMVKHAVDIHTTHINTSHPDFLPNQAKSVKVVKNDKQKKSTNTCGLREGHECEDDDGNDSLPGGQLCINLPTPIDLNKDKSNLDYVLIQELIKSYFGIVLKIIQDGVPKTIMTFLVTYIMTNLHNELIKRLYKGNVDELVYESPKVTKKRKAIEAEVEALQKAYNIINSLSLTLVDNTSAAA